MSSLTDQIDRLNYSTKAIQTITAQIALPGGNFKLSDIGVAGPFTRAVLETHLGDLIRDIDSSELGLFQLTNCLAPSGTDNDTSRQQPPELARTEFGSATPLRRIAARRDESTKLNAEPEIYAHAAMQYIDKYDPIRTMPRARTQVTAILKRIGDVRQHIVALLQALDEVKYEDVPSLKALVEREEELMAEMKIKMAELKRRKHVALERQNPPTIILGTVKEMPTKLDSPEERFDPTSATRVLNFTDNLLDEVNPSNFADMSVADHLGENDLLPSSVSQGTQDLQQILSDERPLGVEQHNTEVERVVNRDTEIKTNAQRKPLPANQNDHVTSYGLRSPTPSPTTSPSEKIVTSRPSNDVIERITRKIWEKAADILGPFHQSDDFGNHAAEVPCTRQVLARLELLSQTDVPQDFGHATTEASMSTAAANTQPTGQQVLIAHFLLTLLSEAPHYSMPLNKVKALLVAKVGGSVSVTAAQGTSRIIYGCVAKRLVKIDRSGREQIVKFDM